MTPGGRRTGADGASLEDAARGVRDVLRDLLRLQTELHGVIRGKLDAMRRADIDDMQAAAVQERQLVQRFAQIDGQRQAAVARWAAATGRDASGVCLAELLADAPQEQRGELAALSRALRDRMLAVADANRVATLVTREMADHFESLFAALAAGLKPAAGYGPAAGAAGACLLDAVG